MLPMTKEGGCTREQDCPKEYPRDLRAGERSAVMAMRVLQRMARNGGTVTAKLTPNGEWVVGLHLNGSKVKAEI